MTAHHAAHAVPTGYFAKMILANWNWCFFMRITTISPNNFQLANAALSVDELNYFKGIQMAHPDHIVAPEQSDTMPLLEPVYPLTAGLTPKMLRRTIGDALTRLPDLPEWIPAPIWSNITGQILLMLCAPSTLRNPKPTFCRPAQSAPALLLMNCLPITALTMVRQQASDTAPGRCFARRLVATLKHGCHFDDHRATTCHKRNYR